MSVETVYICASGEPTHGQAYGDVSCGAMTNVASDTVLEGITTRCAEGGTAGSADCSAYVWADVEMLAPGDLVPTVGGPLRDFATITWGFGEEPPDPEEPGPSKAVLACTGELSVSEGVPLCSGAWSLEETGDTFEFSDLDTGLMGQYFSVGFTLWVAFWALGKALSLGLSMLRPERS